MNYILGIDQGGSKTKAVVMNDSAEVLGIGNAYGACHSVHGMDYAMNAVSEAVSAALKQSGLAIKDIRFATAGMTGADWDHETGLLKSELVKRLGVEDITVVNDCIIAMRAATTKSICGIICAGTGLNCAVKRGDRMFIYGFYIADEHQGGASLGRRTVQAVIDSHLGLISDTALTKTVLSQLEVETVDELLYNRVTGKISETAAYRLPIILEEAAIGGDKVAIAIWEDYARIMATYLTAAMRKIDMLNDEADIVLSGSILKCKVPQFHEVLRAKIIKSAPNVTIKESEYEPIIGAALLALDSLDANHDSRLVAQNLAKSAETFPIRRI